MLKYVAALVFALAAGPAFAQAVTQSPPSASSGASEPQSSNSLPRGAANANPAAIGGGSSYGNAQTGGPGSAMSGTVPAPASK